MKERIRQLLDGLNDSEIRYLLREAVFHGPVKIKGQQVTLEDLKMWLRT